MKLLVTPTLMLLFSFLCVSLVRAQQPLEDTEQLAARALSVTVGVELSARPNVNQQSQVPTTAPLTSPLTSNGATVVANEYLGLINQAQAQSPRVELASGTIVGDGSLVITAGLSPEANDEIRVTLPDGRITAGTFIARDGSGLISICRIQGFQGAALPLAQQDVRAGQPIMSAQYAGEGDFAVRVGIVSAPERMVRQDVGPWIQTDIPADMGSAGGPIVNRAGEVTGIIVATQNESPSASYAISAREISQLVARVAQEESQRQGVIVLESKVPWLGVSLSNDQQALKIDVQTNSPAANAGLQSGDVLISIEGRNVYTPSQVQRVIRRYRSGDQISVRYQRGEAAPVDVSVLLAEMPRTDVSLTHNPPYQDLASGWSVERAPTVLLAYPDANLTAVTEWQAYLHNPVATPTLWLSRTDEDQKLEQLSTQLTEIAKQLSALAEEVQKLRAAETGGQPAAPPQP